MFLVYNTFMGTNILELINKYKIFFVIIIILIKKTEMPHILKKHSANGKSRHHINAHHWLPRHSPIYNFHSMGTRNMRNKLKIGHKSLNPGINDKLHEVFKIKRKWRLLNQIRSKHVNEHYLTPHVIEKENIYSEPSIRSHFSPIFLKSARDTIETGKSLEVTGRLRSSNPFKSNDVYLDGLKKVQKAEIENSSHIGGILIRSNGEDEDYEDEEDDDDDEDYDGIGSKPSESLDSTDDSDYETDYEDIYSQPSSFSLGNKPLVSPFSANRDNTLPQYPTFTNPNSNFQAQSGNQFQQFPHSIELSGSRNMVGGINTHFQFYPAVSEIASKIDPNQQLQHPPPVSVYGKADTFQHEFQPSTFVNQSKMLPVPLQSLDLNQQSANWLQMQGKTGGDLQSKTVSQIPETVILPLNSNTNMNSQSYPLHTVTGGDHPLPQLPYLSLGNSSPFFLPPTAVSLNNQNLANLNAGFNLAPHQLNGRLFNQPFNSDEAKSSYPVGMEMRPEVKGYRYNQPNNIFQKQSSNKALQQKFREDKMNTNGSTMQYYEDLMKNSRSGGDVILLVALVVFSSLSFCITLAAIKYCQYSKDVMNRYPKKKTNLTFTGASKEENKVLLERIGRIKKYDRVNSEELV